VRTALLLVLSIGLASAQTPQKKADPLQPFGFLLGKWNGTGGGQPGSGMGAFSYDAELDGHILVRHNYAECNGTNLRHDDLLIVYLEDSPRAIYFDSEGHVIRYRVTIPSAGSVVFESDGSQPGPRYRLSYVLKGAGLEGMFEIAESASAAYKKYLSWTAKK
jgi:hypothetical protein